MEISWWAAVGFAAPLRFSPLNVRAITRRHRLHARRVRSPEQLIQSLAMAEELLLALSTFPDAETGRRIAQLLVTERLVACANIIPGVESIYRWQDKIESAPETLVLFKTTSDRYGAFQDKLKSLHPYEVPEIICLRIADGLPEYLKWVGENVSC